MPGWTNITIDLEKNKAIREKQRRQRELRQLPSAVPFRSDFDGAPVTGTAIFTNTGGGTDNNNNNNNSGGGGAVPGQHPQTLGNNAGQAGEVRLNLSLLEVLTPATTSDYLTISSSSNSFLTNQSSIASSDYLGEASAYAPGPRRASGGGVASHTQGGLPDPHGLSGATSHFAPSNEVLPIRSTSAGAGPASSHFSSPLLQSTSFLQQGSTGGGRMTFANKLSSPVSARMMTDGHFGAASPPPMPRATSSSSGSAPVSSPPPPPPPPPLQYQQQQQQHQQQQQQQQLSHRPGSRSTPERLPLHPPSNDYYIGRRGSPVCPTPNARFSAVEAYRPAHRDSAADTTNTGVGVGSPPPNAAAPGRLCQNHTPDFSGYGHDSAVVEMMRRRSSYSGSDARDPVEHSEHSTMTPRMTHALREVSMAHSLPATSSSATASGGLADRHSPDPPCHGPLHEGGGQRGGMRSVLHPSGCSSARSIGAGAGHGPGIPNDCPTSPHCRSDSHTSGSRRRHKSRQKSGAARVGEEGDGGEHREDETPMVAQAIPLTPQMYVQGVAEAPDITKWFPPAVPAVCSPVIERGGQIIFTEDWITSQANSPVAHFISSSFTTTPVTPAPGSTTHGGHVFPTSASAAALGSGSHRGGTPAHGTHGPILLPHPHILSHTSGSPVTPPSSTEMNSNATHWTHTTSHPALEESSDVAGVGVSPAVRHALGGAAPSFKIRDPSKIYGSAEYIRSSSTSPAPAPPAASSASSSASPPAIPSEATSTTKHIVPQSDAPTRGGSAKTPKHQPQPSSLTVEKTKKINTATSAAKSEGEKKETRKGTIAGTRAESIATAAAKAAESPLPDHSKSGITTNAMTSEPTSPAGSVASSASGAKTYNKSPSGKTASFTIATIATHKQGATQTSKKSHLKEKR